MTMDVLRLVKPGGSVVEQRGTKPARPEDRASPELLLSAFREMDQAVALVSFSDGVARVVEVNDAFSRRTGIPADAARCADILSLIPAHPANLAALRELRQGLRNNHETTVRLALGGRDDACTEFSLRPLTAGRSASFLCTLRPISNPAPFADGPVGDRLLAFLSHDLRTPLNGILGFSEIMMTDLLGPLAPEDYRSYARDIHEAGQDLLQLVNGLLDISQSHAGSLRLRDEPFSLRRCIDLCLDGVRPRAAAAGVAVRRSIARDLPDFRGDEARLRQVFAILLANAVAASPRGGRVTFRAWHDRHGLHLTCTNSGAGFFAARPAGGASHLCIDYPYGDPQLSTGLGIGLPIVRVLVERHDGSVNVTGRRGSGARVAIHFPADRLVFDA